MSIMKHFPKGYCYL